MEKCKYCGSARDEKTIPLYYFKCGSYTDTSGIFYRDYRPCEEIRVLRQKLIVAMEAINECNEEPHHNDYSECYKIIKSGIEKIDDIA